jgi:hypothetical protein
MSHTLFAVREYTARWGFRALVAAARTLSRVAPEKVLLAISQQIDAVPVCLTAAAARLHQPEGLRVEHCMIDHLSIACAAPSWAFPRSLPSPMRRMS